MLKKSNPQQGKISNRNLERDLSAMRKVLEMLKKGTIRWIGEIGRKY